MKRLGILLLMIVGMTTMAMAQAEIKFNETTHNFGTISKKTPVQKCTFTFTNTRRPLQYLATPRQLR